MGWCVCTRQVLPLRWGEGDKPLPETDWKVMDNDTMLSIHMFGDAQTSEKVEVSWVEPSADEMLVMAYGAYAFDRELTGENPYQDLITLINNRHGEWAYKILDRYTAQALWSLADEHGAHNALEFIESQDDPTKTL